MSPQTIANALIHAIQDYERDGGDSPLLDTAVTELKDLWNEAMDNLDADATRDAHATVIMALGIEAVDAYGIDA